VCLAKLATSAMESFSHKANTRFGRRLHQAQNGHSVYTPADNIEVPIRATFHIVESDPRLIALGETLAQRFK